MRARRKSMTRKKNWRDGEAQLAEAEAELADAREQVEEGQKELADAKGELEDVEPQDWIISNRNEIGDVRGMKITVSSIDALSVSLPLIFLVVAAVICYAAITRMIDEQRVLIGTQKAGGFTAKEILKHYMTYNVLCALLGILIGCLVSIVIVEVVVNGVYETKLLIGTAP